MTEQSHGLVNGAILDSTRFKVVTQMRKPIVFRSDKGTPSTGENHFEEVSMGYSARKSRARITQQRLLKERTRGDYIPDIHLLLKISLQK